MTSASVPPQPRSAWTRHWSVLARWAVGIAVLIAVVSAAGATDLRRATAIVRGAGGWLVLVPLPTLVAMALDASAWGQILAALGRGRPWRSLLALRLGVESVVLAVPGGSIAGEAMKLTLLESRLGVPKSPGAASLALTKTLLTEAAAVYLGSAALMFVVGAPRGQPGAPAVTTAPTALALFLAVLGAGITAALAVVLRAVVGGGRLAALLSSALSAIPLAGLRRRMATQAARLGKVDVATRLFFEAPLRVRARCFGVFLLEWFVEGFETFLILRCLSIPVTVGQALVLDGVGSLLRSFAFFVPAGLGFQDGAQVLLLRSFGIGDASTAGAAFIFVKRTKELFWIVTSGVILTVTRKAWRPNSETSPE